MVWQLQLRYTWLRLSCLYYQSPLTKHVQEVNALRKRYKADEIDSLGGMMPPTICSNGIGCAGTSRNRSYLMKSTS